jgi:adenylate kinase
MASALRGPRLALLGRQGAGKGTQAAALVTHLGVHHLSTGDALRQEVVADTALGRTVADLMGAGELVPDDLVLAVVGHRLAEPDLMRSGVLLDGFPRTTAQAEGLEALLAPDGLDAVIDLEVPLPVARRRLAVRRICSRCQMPTAARHREHTVYCQRCGGMAVRRDDDTPEAIERRLAVHEAEAGPLLAFFAERGLLFTVDAAAPADEVFERVLRALRPVLWGAGEAVG